MFEKMLLLSSVLTQFLYYYTMPQMNYKIVQRRNLTDSLYSGGIAGYNSDLLGRKFHAIEGYRLEPVLPHCGHPRLESDRLRPHPRV